MAEHPDSLWQPYPDEVARRRIVRPAPTPAVSPHRAVPPEVGTGRAVEILEERYARGEIDAGELVERRAVLLAGRD